MSPNMPDLAQRIQQVCSRIQRAELQYQRPEGSVTLIAASKTRSAATIYEAFSQGVSQFGENYLSEALEKIQSPQLSAIRQSLNWHFIGPIQSNKTRAIAEHFDWVHSIDRRKIARRLSEQRPASLEPLQVCIQCNLEAESSKAGVDTLDTLFELADYIATLPDLSLRGLMAIPSPGDEAAQRDKFRQIKDAFDALKQNHPEIDTLSMGMSSDLEAAIAEGSTQVRIGTDLFGPRD